MCPGWEIVLTSAELKRPQERENPEGFRRLSPVVTEHCKLDQDPFIDVRSNTSMLSR